VHRDRGARVYTVWTQYGVHNLPRVVSLSRPYNVISRTRHLYIARIRRSDRHASYQCTPQCHGTRNTNSDFVCRCVSVCVCVCVCMCVCLCKPVSCRHNDVFLEIAIIRRPKNWKYYITSRTGYAPRVWRSLDNWFFEICSRTNIPTCSLHPSQCVSVFMSGR